MISIQRAKEIFYFTIRSEIAYSTSYNFQHQNNYEQAQSNFSQALFRKHDSKNSVKSNQKFTVHNWKKLEKLHKESVSDRHWARYTENKSHAWSTEPFVLMNGVKRTRQSRAHACETPREWGNTARPSEPTRLPALSEYGGILKLLLYTRCVDSSSAVAAL